MEGPDTDDHVWRFGYGSNIGLEVLKQKKNLNPSQYFTGTIKGWSLFFMPGFQYLEPGWAAVRPNLDADLHGSAFCIPLHEAKGLDKQEGGYNVVPCKFCSYDGKTVHNVGLYVPKKEWSPSQPQGIPSLRYLRLLRNGAREGNLSKKWISYLDSIQHYVTPTDVRRQTKQWIADFEADPALNGVIWTAENLARYDGSDPDLPVHSCVMSYVVKVNPNAFLLSPWKGHTVTRRNLLQFNGKSLDTNDIRFGQTGFLPLPDLNDCSDEEREYLLQSLEFLLHRGGVIVARLKESMDSQSD